MEILDDDEIPDEAEAGAAAESAADAEVQSSGMLIQKLARSKREAAEDAAADAAKLMAKRVSSFKTVSRAASSVFAAEGRLTRLAVPDERASLNQQITALEEEARSPVRRRRAHL